MTGYPAGAGLRQFREALELLPERGLIVTQTANQPREVMCPVCGATLMMPAVPAYPGRALARLGTFAADHPDRCPLAEDHLS